ncbi:MAG: toll/interleukin-1 receptor domain-containing protein [Bacteroidales bacterium]|nr:toll/interleukin-1 receptor domain-containing protein [Bacteroidales bacterium]
MQGKNFDIFISYRRSDGEPIARIITETLKGKNYRCFLDYDKLKGGKFDERIEKAIKDAPIFIAVMTPDYLVRPKEDKEKDLSEEEKEKQGEDWVYKEIEIANANNKYIISINHNKKIKSIPKEVPANIAKALGAHTFAEVHDGQTYASNMEDLIKGWISEIVPPPTEKTQGKANIEVSSDADCDILKTGEVIATIAKGGYNILKLPHGEHRLVCRSNEFSDIEQEVKLEIAKDLPDAFFDIKLEKRIQSRRKKRERNRYWEETLRPLLKKIGKGLAIALAAVAIVWALVQAFRSYEGTTETATVTDTEPIVNVNDTTELLAVVPTNSEMLDSKPANESVASEAEAQRQAELEAQQAKERKIKEEQEKKRKEEEKKKQDEKKFNEYKKKGDYNFNMLLRNPNVNYYKEEAKYNYKRALEYKEDAEIRDRYNKLIKEK